MGLGMVWGFRFSFFFSGSALKVFGSCIGPWGFDAQGSWPLNLKPGGGIRRKLRAKTDSGRGVCAFGFAGSEFWGSKSCLKTSRGT